MAKPSGLYFLDGIDLYLNYGLVIIKGSADLLRLPGKKDSIAHNWPDKNGLDVDLTKIFVKERTVTLQCLIITLTEAEFWVKHNAFYQKLVQPGYRRLTITAHGNRSYHVFYQDCNGYQQIKSLRDVPDNMVVHSFNLVLMEPEPEMVPDDTFIVADDGAFLIT